jgi:hypothetical protein
VLGKHTLYQLSYTRSQGRHSLLSSDPRLSTRLPIVVASIGILEPAASLTFNISAFRFGSVVLQTSGQSDSHRGAFNRLSAFGFSQKPKPFDEIFDS